MTLLSIIIPFGFTNERPFIEERTIKKIYEIKHKDVEVIFVEGFSPDHKEYIINEIQKNGHIYIRDKKQTKFSVGACRNIGVQYASSPVITFLDVDYYMSKNTLNKIINLIKIKKIDTYPNRFFFLPCAFLTEEGTKFIQSNDSDLWDTIVQYDIISLKKGIVKFLSISSSSPVMNRHKFLELGGNDGSFQGHGYEDFDFYYRLFKSSSRIEIMPEKIEYDSRSWNFVDYKGFRALISVPGYEAAFYGIYLYHFWHQEPNNNGYLDNREINHQKFYNRIKKYFILSDGPDCIQDKEAIDKKILAFIPENSKVYRSLRGVTPYIGKLICCNEAIFFDSGKFSSTKLINYIKENNIDKILFPNPYGNEKRLKIYNFVKKNNLPYICFDRGALPDSWFFDINGFNYDSTSYSEENWNHKLTNEEYLEVYKYIDKIKNTNNFLEAQGEKVGKTYLKQQLGIRFKKVVFVPLQVETDTVIKYFTREPFTYYSFIESINNIAGKLEEHNWVFLVKKHPLMSSIEKSKYKNLKFVPDDTNIIDLIETSNIVLTINSGVGIYAMIYEKPCLLAGNAFYSFKNLNYEVYSENDIISRILENNCIDKEKMYRFIYYLYKKFYSYGKSYYSNINEKGRIRRIVNYIDYYKIVIDKKIYVDGQNSDLFIYKKDTLSLKPYIFEINNIKKINSNKGNKIEQEKSNIIINRAHNKSNKDHSITLKKIKKFIMSPKKFIIDYFIKIDK